MSELLITKKAIDLAQSPVLFDKPFDSRSLESDWLVRSAEWWIDGEWLAGRNPDNSGGIITSRESFFGNVCMEFEARTVLPSTHDIDCFWNGSWDDEKKERGTAYVMGLQGWWDGKAGFEKSPEYRLNATTSLFPFEPGRIYRILTGSAEGHLFLFIDGRLIIEMTDPDPIDYTRYGLVGFEAYSSMIQVRRPIIRQVVWRERPGEYAPEF